MKPPIYTQLMADRWESIFEPQGSLINGGHSVMGAPSNGGLPADGRRVEICKKLLINEV